MKTPIRRILEQYLLARTFFAVVALCLGARGLSAQAAADTTASIAFVNATVIDGTGRPPRPNQTVLIQGERIVAIFPASSPNIATTDDDD